MDSVCEYLIMSLIEPILDNFPIEFPFSITGIVLSYSSKAESIMMTMEWKIPDIVQKQIFGKIFHKKYIDHVFDFAVSEENLLVMEWYYTGIGKHIYIYKMEAEMSEIAALRGRMDLIKRNQISHPFSRLSIFAARGNHLKIIEMIQKLGYKLSPKCYTEAAKNNSIEILDFLFSKNVPLETADGFNLISEGNLKVYEWAKSKYFVMDVNSPMNAVITKSMEKLKWFVENDVLFSNNILSRAIESGDSEITKFVWENTECFIDKEDIENKFLEYSDLDLIKWISSVKIGFTFSDKGNITAAIRSGKMEIVEWLEKKLINMDVKHVKYSDLIWNPSINIVKWAISKGYQLPKILWDSGSIEDVGFLKYLITLGFEITDSLVKTIIRDKLFRNYPISDILDWIMNEYPEKFDYEALIIEIEKEVEDFEFSLLEE